MLWFLGGAEGKPQRRKIITRKNGYHGVTGRLRFNDRQAIQFSVRTSVGRLLATSPAHHYWREGRDGETETEFTARMAQELEDMIAARRRRYDRRLCCRTRYGRRRSDPTIRRVFPSDPTDPEETWHPR